LIVSLVDIDVNTSEDQKALIGFGGRMPTGERKTITVTEAGAQLGLGRNSAYEAAKRGEIPTVKIGRRLLVPRDAVDRLLAQAMIGSAEERAA
jgi:excisionase family DNA binding protein